MQRISKPITFAASPQSRNWLLVTELMEEGEEVCISLPAFCTRKLMNLFTSEHGENSHSSCSFLSVPERDAGFSAPLVVADADFGAFCLILLT